MLGVHGACGGHLFKPKYPQPTLFKVLSKIDLPYGPREGKGYIVILVALFFGNLKMARVM